MCSGHSSNISVCQCSLIRAVRDNQQQRDRDHENRYNLVGRLKREVRASGDKLIDAMARMHGPAYTNGFIAGIRHAENTIGRHDG